MLRVTTNERERTLIYLRNHQLHVDRYVRLVDVYVIFFGLVKCMNNMYGLLQKKIVYNIKYKRSEIAYQRNLITYFYFVLFSTSIYRPTKRIEFNIIWNKGIVGE